MASAAQHDPRRTPPERPPRRLGPRPLPQHLGLAMSTWLNSAAILPSLRIAWQSSAAQDPGQAAAQPAANPLRESVARRLAELGPQLDRANPEALAAALQAEGHARLDAFLTGVETYRHHAFHRDLPEMPVLWRAGTTRLLDYRPADRGARPEMRPRLLVVPSLVNRYYILDLAAEGSFLRHMADRGFDPLVVDWGAPGPVERGFDLSAYIAGRLEAVLDAVAREPGGPIFVIGYCMGGNLALALALRRAADIAGLVCLATPWDFHADGAGQSRVIGQIGRQLEPVLQILGELPVDILQCFFSGLDPFQVLRKFQSFAGLDPSSDAARRFVMLEDWLNDGIALAAAVTRECMTEWYGENTPARGEWRVAGSVVDPARVALPSLCIVPAADRIVPPASALALANALRGGDRLTPNAGHIGMMAGRGASPQVWQPLTAWLQARSA